MTDDDIGGGAGQADREQERWFLNDQRDFLLRSIDDAAREHDAGDLATADYDVLRRRDETRLAEVEADLAALGPVTADPAVPEPEPGPVVPRSRRSTWRLVGIVATSLLILLGAGILVNHAVNPALPGQAVSGSITQSKEQQIEGELQQAAILNNNGNAAGALQLYDRILADDPDDPVALAASGWVEWNVGEKARSATLMKSGRRNEQKAIRLAPTYYAGHLFYGLILFNQDDNTTGAITQFTKLLAESPPKAELASVAPLVASAYNAAKVPLPAALSAAIPTTTTTTATPTTPTTSAP
jgi:tetratricopeptide (TPR) repeat protein